MDAIAPAPLHTADVPDVDERRTVHSIEPLAVLVTGDHCSATADDTADTAGFGVTDGWNDAAVMPAETAGATDPNTPCTAEGAGTAAPAAIEMMATSTARPARGITG